MIAVTDLQRQVIEQDGTPLPVIDDRTNCTYILVSVKCIANADQGTFTASIPGIAAYGEGETQEDASLALCEALRAYQDAFRDT